MKKRIIYTANNTNQNSIINSYNFNTKNKYIDSRYITTFEYDENDNLIMFDSTKLKYNIQNQLIRINSIETDGHDYSHYETDFEYYDTNVLVKKRRISSYDFYSQFNNDDQKDENILLESSLLTKDEVLALIPPKIKFHDEEDIIKNFYKYNFDCEWEIVEQNDLIIKVRKNSKTEFYNTISEFKDFKIHYPSNQFLLFSYYSEVIFENGAEYYSEYDNEGNIILVVDRKFNSDKSPNFDYEAQHFKDRQNSGIEYYNFDNKGNISYLENDFSIVLISLVVNKNGKIEKEIIVNKREKKFYEGYSILLEEFN